MPFLWSLVMPEERLPMHAAAHLQQQAPPKQTAATASDFALVHANMPPSSETQQLQQSARTPGPQHQPTLQLHHLPATALAEIANHLTTADKLQLGRLVFGKWHPEAAAAVLATIQHCSIRKPIDYGPCRCSRGCYLRSGTRCRNSKPPDTAGGCPASSHSSTYCYVGAASDLLNLRKLSLELHLPQPKQRYLEAAVSSISKLSLLTSLTLHVQQNTTAASEHTQEAQQMVQLMQAVGGLKQCKELVLQLEYLPLRSPAPAQPEVMTVAAAGRGIQNNSTYLPLVSSSLGSYMLQLPCLQSLALSTADQLPVSELMRIGQLRSLTSLLLACKAGSCEHSADIMNGHQHDMAVAAALQHVLPQLRQLSVNGYFHMQWAQQQPDADVDCLGQLLQHLVPSKLQQLDLGYNTCRVPPAAVSSLAALTSLCSLSLAGTAVTADDLALLGQQLRQVTQLDVSNDTSSSTSAQTAGNYSTMADPYGASVLPLQHWLPFYTQLQELHLQRRSLSFHDILAVFDLPQLKHVDISSVFVLPGTLAGAFETAWASGLASVQSITQLALSDVRLGADGLNSLHLERLRGLLELDLRGCRTGTAAVTELQQALPGLQVVMDGLDWADEGLEWLIGDY